MNLLTKINKNIKVQYIDEEFIVPEDLKNAISADWKKYKNKFFNGRIFHVKEVIEDDDTLTYVIINDNYAHYLYTRNNDLPQEYASNNIWCGAVIESSDNKIILGKQSKMSSREGFYNIAAGSCDKDDLNDGFLDLKKTMKRELYEEFGIEINNRDVQNISCLYIKEPSFKEEYSTGIIYKIKLNIPYDNFEKKFNRFKKYLAENQMEIEVDSIIGLNTEGTEIKEFIEANKDKMLLSNIEILLQEMKSTN